MVTIPVWDVLFKTLPVQTRDLLLLQNHPCAKLPPTSPARLFYQTELTNQKLTVSD